MNYNKLFIFLILSLIAGYFVYVFLNKSSMFELGEKSDFTLITKNQEQKQVIGESQNQFDPKVLKLGLKISPEIMEFNEYVKDNVNSLGTSKKNSLFSNFINAINEDNLSDIAAEINYFIENPQKNQLQIREVINFCDSLKKRENNSLPKSTQSAVRGELFLLALQESSFCDILGTENDPFYVMLELARKGDKLAQLWLISDLGSAVNRKVIDPKLYPSLYNDLRSEVINYLSQLSARGVIEATIILQNLYSNNDNMVPRDPVLRYFYLKLAERQNNNLAISWLSSEKVYSNLTKIEKAKAERMLERAGF